MGTPVRRRTESAAAHSHQSSVVLWDYPLVCPLAVKAGGFRRSGRQHRIAEIAAPMCGPDVTHALPTPDGVGGHGGLQVSCRSCSEWRNLSGRHLQAVHIGAPQKRYLPAMFGGLDWPPDTYFRWEHPKKHLDGPRTLQPTRQELPARLYRCCRISQLEYHKSILWDCPAEP